MKKIIYVAMHHFTNKNGFNDNHVIGVYDREDKAKNAIKITENSDRIIYYRDSWFEIITMLFNTTYKP